MEMSAGPALPKEYQGLSYVSGPLLYMQGGRRFPYGAMLDIILADGEVRNGQVLELDGDLAVVQVLETTAGIDVVNTRVRLQEVEARVAVSSDLIGRVLDGRGRPRDGLSTVRGGEERSVHGAPINPAARIKPDNSIETGVTAIDAFNTLVRGQKLPIFSGSGLPANELAAQIVRHARVPGSEEPFVVVFGAMGLTQREASYFLNRFKQDGSLSKTVCFLNLASDPTVERLLTPRCALTVAEYLAFEKDYHVLVILTDMTSYCDALREIGAAREEIPGRRGYPGYMYTDLASLYERAGMVRGRKGSVTQIPILSMPEDDITHPIPDLTGYITEGQIVLSRALYQDGIEPPIDVLPSLSRLMNNGIGKGRTREDHRQLVNQLYAAYAQGRDVRRLSAIVGEDSLSELDRMYLKFSDEFERDYIGQGETARALNDSLDQGWRLLQPFPQRELTRIDKDLISRYFNVIMKDGTTTPFFDPRG